MYICLFFSYVLSKYILKKSMNLKQLMQIINLIFVATAIIATESHEQIEGIGGNRYGDASILQGTSREDMANNNLNGTETTEIQLNILPNFQSPNFQHEASSSGVEQNILPDFQSPNFQRESSFGFQQEEESRNEFLNFDKPLAVPTNEQVYFNGVDTDHPFDQIMRDLSTIAPRDKQNDRIVEQPILENFDCDERTRNTVENLDLNFGDQHFDQMNDEMFRLPVKDKNVEDSVQEIVQQQKILHSEEYKREIVTKFYAMKKEYFVKNKLKEKKKKNGIDDEIARELGHCRTTIFKWKKALGLSGMKIYSDEEKRKIIKKFDTMKKVKCLTEYTATFTRKIEEEIAQKLGKNRRTIYEWKNKFGNERFVKRYTNFEKKGLLRRYNEIKAKNSKLTVSAIAEMLKVSETLIYRLKKKVNDDEDVESE